MISTLKTVAFVAALAVAGISAQSARADHVSVGIGVNVPVRTYVAPTVVYSRPAVTYVAAPTYTYVAPAYVAPTYYGGSYYGGSYYSSSYVASSYSYCPPAPVVYTPPVVCPPPVVYAPPVYYSAPAYYGPTYYSSPSFGISFGWSNGGGGHRR